MRNGRNFLIIGAVIVIAVILQVILVSVGKVDTPAGAAVDFTKAYFMLDPSMSEWLCSELAEDEEINVVDQYLHRVAEQARAMGFTTNYMKNQLSHIETETIISDDSTAEVRITCDRMRSINPVYAVIGKLFFLIETHEVDATLNLVKEDGKWKVCGKPFAFAEINEI
jgi:hypothetical protein